MIKVIACIEEDGTRVRVEEMTGKINDILDETSAIVATVVGNILAQEGPSDVRLKEYEQFILQEITKRMKEAVKQLNNGEAEVNKEQPKKIIEPKKKSIITKENGTNNGFLN